MSNLTAQGIGEFVRRIGHVVINVTDLDRSVEFYESVSTLRSVAQFEPPAQAYEPFDLGGAARIRGRVLEDPTGGSPVAVHLVQWLDPEPCGDVIRSFHDAGLVKIGIGYPDPVVKRRELEAVGARFTNEVTVRNYFTIFDPDDIVVTFLNSPDTQIERMYHTVLSVRDVEQNNWFYRDLIGLDHWMQCAIPEPVPASHGPGSDEAHFDSNIFRSYGDHRFSLDCSTSFLGPDHPMVTRVPNHVGINRVGIEVRDVDECHRRLTAACEGEEYGPIGPVGTWEMDDKVGSRRVCAVFDPNGHLIELFEPLKRQFVDATAAWADYVSRQEAGSSA